MMATYAFKARLLIVLLLVDMIINGMLGFRSSDDARVFLAMFGYLPFLDLDCKNTMISIDALLAVPQTAVDFAAAHLVRCVPVDVEHLPLFIRFAGQLVQ